MELEKNSNVESERRCSNQTFCHFPCPEEAEYVRIRDVAAGANHSGFGQAHSANVSELKSEESLPYLNSSLDASIEMYNKKGMKICCTWVAESKEDSDKLGMVCDNMHRYRSQSHLGEDSQLKYLGAHEEDFDDESSSSEFSEQRETIGIETLKLIDSVHEASGDRFTEEQNLLEVSEGSASECGVGDQVCPEAALLEPCDLLKQSMSLPDCNDMSCFHQEEQTEYHSVVCGSILEKYSCGSKAGVCPSLLVCNSIESEEVKDVLLIDSMVPPQITTSEEVSEKSDQHIHRISVKQDSPLLPPRERVPAVAIQFCEQAGHSNLNDSEESSVCTRDASCTDCTAKDSELQFPVSEITTSKNPFFGFEVADKSSHQQTTSCVDLECCETLKNVIRGSTVDQAVDGSSDFRACFTTSRSTSAQVCLSSRAINTEITMMNKSRPVGFNHEAYADVACNTEWSCGAGDTEKVWSRLTDILQKYSDGNTSAAERRTEIQEQKESKLELCGSILKRSTDSFVLGTREPEFESPKLQEKKISANMDDPQTVCLTDGNQPSDSISYETDEEQCKDQDVESGIHMNDYWFDAEEDLTLADFSVISEEAENQQDKHDTVDLREAKIMESGNECSFVHVGGLSSSVSEGDLRSNFKKYQVSDILMSVDSSNYRYAVLSFKDINKAKLAVEEMNQKTIKGKPVSVELVNTSSKNKYLVSQVPTNKPWHEIQPVHNDRRNCQYKTLTSASSSVKAPDATSASEKTHLFPITSNISCSTQVPSETKCPGLKSSAGNTEHYLLGANQKDTGENFQQKTSAPFSINPYDDFISPNTLNLSSYAKLMTKLQEIHPEARRDTIVDALLKVRENNNGILNGLPINFIVERTSAILRKLTPSCGWEKQRK